MVSSIPPILIAGAGPSGCAAALTLLQNNIPIRIIDKESHIRPGQGGSMLCSRTFEVFHILRAHEIHQRATPVPPVREYKPGTLEPTKTFSSYPHNDPTPSVPYGNPKFLGQPTLEAILRSHMEKYGCFVEMETRLESFEDDGERVLAKLVKSKDGEEVTEIFEASYLIGTDGAKGVTRKQLGLEFLGETREEFSAILGDICIENIGEIGRNHWHFFGTRSADLCMLRPTDEIAPDGFRLLIFKKDNDPMQLMADEKLVFKHISKLMGHEIKVRKVVTLSGFRANIRMVDKFGRGRVFVAGDSAHVHSPTGGQGLNTSVQDALNLGWKLSLVYKGHSPATLLDSYTTERLPVIAEMLNITTGMLHNIRNASTIESAMEREKRLNMLGVNYRTSAIVVDEFAHAEPVSAYGVLNEGALVAGDRAPDAPGLTPLVTSGADSDTRLFDVFSATYHTVLMFTSDASAGTGILEVLWKYPRDLIRPIIVLPQGSEGATVDQVAVVVDHGGHAYRAYLAVEGEQKVVVVRPDGVVGAIVRDAGGVKIYFDKIFV